MVKKNKAKVGQMFWMTSHGAYYCEVTKPDGTRRQHRLGTVKAKADSARSALLRAIEETGQGDDFSVRQICNLFMESVAKTRPDKTYKNIVHYVKPFCDSLPEGLLVRELKVHHAVTWLDEKYPVGKGSINTRRTAIGILKRVFNWACLDMEYINRNPLTRLHAPKAKPSAACPTRDQWQTVLDNLRPNDPFRVILEFLLQTGCRPQEARIVEGRHIDWVKREIHFADGEIPGNKLGHNILLTERAYEMVKELAELHPTGPLFRNREDEPWLAKALTKRVLDYKKRYNPDFKLKAYAARHTVATDMLDNGASAGAVAAVLGHKDATMVLKTYGKHIEDRKEHLLAALTKATIPKPSGRK